MKFKQMKFLVEFYIPFMWYINELLITIRYHCMNFDLKLYPLICFVLVKTKFRRPYLWYNYMIINTEN